MQSFSTGQIVAVCYDGKFTRAVEGKVTSVGPDYIKVMFLPWANEEAGFIEAVFTEPQKGLAGLTNKTYTYYTGMVVGKGENGIQGWLSGIPGDVYTLLPKDIVIEEEYMVEPYSRQQKK